MSEVVRDGAGGIQGDDSWTPPPPLARLVNERIVSTALRNTLLAFISNLVSLCLVWQLLAVC